MVASCSILSTPAAALEGTASANSRSRASSETDVPSAGLNSMRENPCHDPFRNHPSSTASGAVDDESPGAGVMAIALSVSTSRAISSRNPRTS